MNKFLLVVAAVLAASSVYAREPKKKVEAAPPPPPAVEYENDDVHMSDAIETACIATPAEQETYDSRDNVMITKIDGGGRAFFHLKGGCDTNTIIFADTIKADDGTQCVKPGASIVFTSAYGDQKKCEVVRINRWLDDELISPEDAQ
ncbi:MAG: hypothetical protein AAB227_03790 [Pseudomonadota bacterium]